MKLSDFEKVASLLKSHSSIADVEKVVENVKTGISALPLADEMKAKLGSALSSVVDDEKDAIKSKLEALGVEVDTEVKSAFSKIEGAFASARTEADKMLQPAADLLKHVETASLEWSERLKAAVHPSA